MRVRAGLLFPVALLVPVLVDAEQIPIVVYYEDEQIVRIERDTNLDGHMDQWEHYVGSKKPIRIE